MEKRSAERFDLCIPATVFVEGDDLQQVLRLETENISSRGTFLRTDEPVPEGVKVEVELYLPVEKWMTLLGPGEGIRVNVRGTVIRTQRDGVAIEFDRNYRIQPFDCAGDRARTSPAAEGR